MEAEKARKNSPDSLPDPPAGKRRRIFGMGAKFTILIVGVLLLLSVFSIHHSTSQMRKAVSLGMEEMATAMGRVLGLASAYQGFFGIDDRQLVQYLESAVAQPDVVYAAIFMEDRMVYRGISGQQAELLRKGEHPFDPELIFQERQDIELESPVGKIGEIVVGISRERLNQEQNRIIRGQVLAASGVGGLSLIVLWTIVFSITRPLRKLAVQAEKIGQGELDEPVSVKTGDEVGLLAESVEKMRGEIFRNIRKLTFLGELSHSLNSAGGLEEAFEQVRRKLRDHPVCRWHQAGVALVGRGIPDSRLHYYRIFPAPGKEERAWSDFSLPGTVIAEVLQRKKPIIRPDAGRFKKEDIFSLQMKETGVASDLYWPLMVKSACQGVLYMGFSEDEAESREVGEIAQNLADDLAGTVERVYLVEDLRMNLKQLKRVHQELKSLDGLKTEFISSVSHELRTPLVSLSGYLDLMLEEKLGTLNREQKEGIAISVKSLDRLTELIDKMLTFSSQQKAERIEPSEFDLKPTLEHCLAMVRPSALQKKIEVALAVEDGLPGVRADEDRIIQVVINLLDNAIKFSPQGSRVELKARRPFKQTPDREGRLEVLVRDRGRGIPEEDIPRIFEKFWQGKTDRPAGYRGVGLGLAMVKRILELHGCVIEVQSAEGRGSTFVFTIPISPSAAEAPPGVE